MGNKWLKAAKETILWATLFCWSVLAAVPAEYWVDPGSTRVSDFPVGEDFILVPTRTVKKDFKGSYTVVIRKATSQEIVSEDPSGIFPYTTKSSPPDTVRISYWSPRAKELKKGYYEMTTCWTVHSPFYGLVPSKTTCSISNVFEVL